MCAVKYLAPCLNREADVAKWVNENPRLAESLDLNSLAAERAPFPAKLVATAPILTDDFSPVEFLDALKTNNTKAR